MGDETSERYMFTEEPQKPDMQLYAQTCNSHVLHDQRVIRFCQSAVERIRSVFVCNIHKCTHNFSGPVRYMPTLPPENMGLNVSLCRQAYQKRQHRHSQLPTSPLVQTSTRRRMFSLCPCSVLFRVRRSAYKISCRSSRHGRSVLHTLLHVAQWPCVPSGVTSTFAPQSSHFGLAIILKQTICGVRRDILDRVLNA